MDKSLRSYKKEDLIQPDAWQSLKAFTSARIALGRTGESVPLKESLNFKLAHAHARDAVYSALKINVLTDALQKFNLPIVHLHSAVSSRQEYLQRPDNGRKLNGASVEKLAQFPTPEKPDVSIIIADGLSAQAIHDHVVSLLDLLVPALHSSKLTLAPVCIAEQARVAISDEIGSLLQARLAIIFIGERPGLSSPNSLGAYLTYQPRVGLTDESRNCVSNIRPEGLSYTAASVKIFYLITEALKRKLSGVDLKEEGSLAIDR